jgi:hypothetical protein
LFRIRFTLEPTARKKILSVVEVKSVEQVTMEMLPELGVGHRFGMPLAQRFAHDHQKAASSAGRIADNVRGLRLNPLHHEPDDVARRAELPVLSSRRRTTNQ